MSGERLTPKQMQLLQLLSKHVVIAFWKHSQLAKLRDMDLVTGVDAYCSNGRISPNYIWAITTDGRAFLDDAERRA